MTEFEIVLLGISFAPCGWQGHLLIVFNGYFHLLLNIKKIKGEVQTFEGEIAHCMHFWQCYKLIQSLGKIIQQNVSKALQVQYCHQYVKSHKNAYNLTNPTSGNLSQRNIVIAYQSSEVTFMKGNEVGCHPKKLLW